MLPSQGVTEALPNPYKQMQGSCQNKEIKKFVPIERTDQNSRKRTKWNGDKQSIRCRVQNIGYKDVKELSEDLNSIKKIQSGMKDTLIEIKNNLQGNSSRVDEAKNQINDLEHKTKKQTIRIRRRKRNKKNEDSVNSLWNNFECSNIWIIGLPEGKEKEQEIGNLFEKIMKENFPDLVKKIDMQVQKASTESQIRGIQRAPLQGTSSSLKC